MNNEIKNLNQFGNLRAQCYDNGVTTKCVPRVLMTIVLVLLLSGGMIALTSGLFASETGQSLVNVELFAVPFVYASMAAALSVAGALPFLSSVIEIRAARDGSVAVGLLGFLGNFVAQTALLGLLFVITNAGLNAVRAQHLAFTEL